MKTEWGWKNHVKAVLPKRMLDAISESRFRRMNRRVDADFAGENAAEVFSNVYKSGIWGRKSGTDFYSGGGSHEPHLVNPYVKAVVGFLSSLSSKPSVVDLGCGDFNVGSRLRPFCEKYIACDVVPDLIDRNRKAFPDIDVDFRCLNAVLEDLPDADVVFLRQVLQHLSNDQIGKVVAKLQKYRYLVLSESLPVKPGFLPNMEKQTGPGMRVASRSGVVVTEPPFSLPFVTEQDICMAVNQATLIRTTVYKLH